MRHITPVTNSAALCRSLPSLDRLSSHLRGTQAVLSACTAHSRLKRPRPKLLHASLQQHQAWPHRDSSYSKHQLSCCPHTRTLHVTWAIAKQRPLSDTAQPSQSQMLPGSVFRSCFNLIQQGKIGPGLDLLQRLIGEHGPPDKADGFAILLVSLSASDTAMHQGPYWLQILLHQTGLCIKAHSESRSCCNYTVPDGHRFQSC